MEIPYFCHLYITLSWCSFSLSFAGCSYFAKLEITWVPWDLTWGLPFSLLVRENGAIPQSGIRFSDPVISSVTLFPHCKIERWLLGEFNKINTCNALNPYPLYDKHSVCLSTFILRYIFFLSHLFCFQDDSFSVSVGFKQVSEKLEFKYRFILVQNNFEIHA